MRNVIAFVVLAAMFPLGRAWAQTVVLVSQSTNGLQGNGDSRAPRLSADGKWVVFKSDASTLVPGDTNGKGDVFLRDVVHGTTTLISVGLGGASANGESFAPSISADGSVIAFMSSATNLVVGDTNGKNDIFVWEAGVITRVSLGSGGVQSNGASDKPSVSGDGRFVAFESTASNLVAGDANGAADIFRFDRATGSVVRASVSSSGAEANGASHNPWLNGDGSVVAFESLASNLVAGDTNASSDVFARDLIAGSTVSATIFPGLVGNGTSDSASISADGQHLAFRSDATNLSASDTNAASDVFLADPWNHVLQRVSEGAGGVQANGASSFPQLAPDAQSVTFSSAASNLVAGDTNARDDVFVYDVATASAQRISVDAYGAQGNGHSRAPTIANGGKSIAFKSDASNLVSGDTNGIGDVFLRHPAPMTWYVDASAVPPGDGSSGAPFVAIQDALDDGLLDSGDTVLVNPGTYLGGVVVPDISITIQSASGPMATILSGAGATTVVDIETFSSTPNTFVVDGFSIRDGFGTGCDISGCGLGGGVFFNGSGYLSVRNCIIESCAASAGAAISAVDPEWVEIDSSLIRSNVGYSAVDLYHGLSGLAAPCSISGCTIELNGGTAVYAYGADAIIVGSIVRDNFGDAIDQSWGGFAAIRDCTIDGNDGGIELYTCDGSVDKSTINGNSFAFIFDESTYWDLTDTVISNNGSGIGNYEGVITLTRCTIEANQGALWNGPQMYFATTQLRGCVITNNKAWPGAGAPIYVQLSGSVKFDHCTIAGNVGVDSGWLKLDDISGYDSIQLTNSIAFANVPPLPSPVPDPTAPIRYCDFEFPFPGQGCISANPQFWDVGAFDVRLVPSSPCIDAGDPLSPPDPDGSRADMGAIPFDPNYCGTPRVYCTAKVNSLGCTPTLAWSGTPSLNGANDDFHVVAANVLSHKNGLLFWGTLDAAIPFEGGTLCVKPPIVRTSLQSSGGNPPPTDCSGSYDLHFTQAYMHAFLFQTGTTIYAQYWSRDPGFAAPNNVGLTSALRFVACP